MTDKINNLYQIFKGDGDTDDKWYSNELVIFKSRGWYLFNIGPNGLLLADGISGTMYDVDDYGHLVIIGVDVI